jgi:tRNA/tmRNA/rRNA uracil-C5-methylase (TrmA/RlmC/RlmD family)
MIDNDLLRLGIYSILASSLVKKVYAIDPVASLIENGKINAQLNNCRDNIEWISGFAEVTLHRILKKIGDLHDNNSRMVVIVNPTRYSLSK